MKLYVVGGSRGEAESHADWLHADLVPSIEDADLVLFRGGDDVDPQLYGERRNPNTDMPNLARDRYEVKEFNVAKYQKKPMIGICRGSQFLCVMAGGKLVQDQEHQGYLHEINVWNDPARGGLVAPEPVAITVTSSHHQAQFPWGLPDSDFKVLGWSNGLSSYHHDWEGSEMVPDNNKEVEICFYPKINALGIQSHPEYREDRSKQYMRDLVGLFMEGRL